MFRFLIFALILGCFPNRAFRKDFTVLSESPCVDGTLLNIYESGCASTYLGQIDGDVPIIKVRCTYSNHDNWMTQTSFYLVPSDQPHPGEDWQPYCRDLYVDVYASPTN
jgi:hypothetical protein